MIYNTVPTSHWPSPSNFKIEIPKHPVYSEDTVLGDKALLRSNLSTRTVPYGMGDILKTGCRFLHTCCWLLSNKPWGLGAVAVEVFWQMFLGFSAH